MRALLSRLPIDAYIASILGMVALASALPAEGPGMTVASWAGTAAIALMFFLQGARLAPQAALAGARHWRLHAVVLGSTFLVFPMLGLTMRAIAPGLLTPPLWGGVLMLCLLPSTVQSSIAFTSIARGNVAAAVCSASLSNLIGVVLSPLLVSLLLGANARVSGSSMLDVAAQLLLPFIAGQLARPRIAPALKRHPRVLATVDRGSVLIVVYTAFGEGVVAGIWHRVSWQQLVTLGVIDIALLAVVLTTSSVGGRMLGFERGDRIAAVFCGSKKSLASGLPMATLLFPAATVSTIVLPLMLFHQIQLFACAALSKRYARQEVAPAARTTSQTTAVLSLES